MQIDSSIQQLLKSGDSFTNYVTGPNHYGNETSSNTMGSWSILFIAENMYLQVDSPSTSGAVCATWLYGEQ